MVRGRNQRSPQVLRSLPIHIQYGCSALIIADLAGLGRLSIVWMRHVKPMTLAMTRIISALE
jgi:hypothetical protein